MEFDALPLHDATLATVHVDYATAHCEFVLHVVGGSPYKLVFDGLLAMELPKREPWGRSCSINAGRQFAAQGFELQLQSGDVLRVEAERWNFLPLQP